MWFKFIKSIKIFPWMKLNFNLNWISTTFWTKWLSVNLNKNWTYLNMWIPWTWLYYRKKIWSNNDINKNIDLSNNIWLNKNMWILRKIILYIQRIFVFIFSILFLLAILKWEIWNAIFILLIIILIDYYDFKSIISNIFYKNVSIRNNNLKENNIIIEKYNNYQDKNYNDDNNYYILKCENWEILDTRIGNIFFNNLEIEKQNIYDKYWKLSIEFEEIKQFWNLNKIIDLENKIHNYFIDELFPKMLKLELIYTINPIKEKVLFNNLEIDHYNYMWKLVPKKKFYEYKNILDDKIKFYKEWTNDYLYDLYAKSLRRLWNYYKQNKFWKEANSIFNIIENIWQSWIMDKKSMIKIKKELWE